MNKIITITILIIIAQLNYAQSCLEFDGLFDRVTANPTAINEIGNGDFTLEAWVEGSEDQNQDFPMILSNRNTANDGVLFFFHDATNKELCIQLDGGNHKLENNGGYGKILDGTRHHVAISRNAELLSFYVDGELIGTRNIFVPAPTLSGNAPLLIGYDKPTGNPFEGIISNVRVWNIARTQEEINATLNLKLPNGIENLVLNFPLDEGEGTMPLDLVSGDSADFGGDGLSEQFHPEWIDNCESFTINEEDLDNCLEFDGIDDQILGSASALNTIANNNFTIEAWIQSETQGLSGFPMIFSNRQTSNDGTIFFFHNGNSSNPIKELCLQMSGVNYLINDNGIAGNILDGSRHHVAVVRDGSILTFYIDGVDIGIRNLQSNNTLAGDGPLQIGYDDPTGNPFKGILSNIRTWNIARSQEEILSTINVSLPIGVPNLVMHYKLNKGEGNSVLDQGNATVATFGSTPDIESEYPTWIENCETFTDTKNIDNSLIVNAYPNPANDILYVELSESHSDINVIIYDKTGRKLREEKRQNNSSLVIDLQDINMGHYIVQITTEEITSVMQLVVVK